MTTHIKELYQGNKLEYKAHTWGWIEATQLCTIEFFFILVFSNEHIPSLPDPTEFHSLVNVKTRGLPGKLFTTISGKHCSMLDLDSP